MTPGQTQLWEKIQNFELDESTANFKFSDRLARENRWKIDYTKRVILEYKKFIFLCCITESGVTPSDPVDQAWHLHLTFTRSYWIDMCKNTLQKEIHHNPTKRGANESSKFNNYYSYTHKLYNETFKSVPPADIWQNNQIRFSDINFQRINIGRYWLLKKPRFTIVNTIIFTLVAAGVISIQASYDQMFGIVVIGLFVIGMIRAGKNKGKDGDNPSSCNSCGTSDGHHGDHSGHGGDSGCGSGCSGCSSSGCSGCGGGH